MSQAISQEKINSVLRVLRQDQGLKDRLSANGDSEALIEEIVKKAGVEFDFRSFESVPCDYDVTDQELEDMAPQAGTKKCNFQCGNLLTIGK